MNTLQTDIAIVTAILWLMAIAVVAYDRIKYHKYYASKSKLVVLRINNAAVREVLSQNGIKLCQCAYYKSLSLHHRGRSHLWLHRVMHASDRRCRQAPPGSDRLRHQRQSFRK